jgi:hypothetical protein
VGKVCPPPKLNPNYTTNLKIERVGKIKQRPQQQQQQLQQQQQQQQQQYRKHPDVLKFIKRRILQKRKAKTMALKKISKHKKQIGGLGPAAGVALGMALPMLLNSGTSIVGSIFGKNPAQQQQQPRRQQQQYEQQYVPPAQPQWMGSTRRRRRRRRRNYDDYDDY